MQTTRRVRRPANPVCEILESRQLLSGTPAVVTNFSDSFTPVASSLWDDRYGNWTTSNGTYYAQNPINTPFATSELPYVVGDFTATVTANNLTDGGLWIHNDGTNQNGIVLVLGGEGYGQGLRGGKAGNSIYWQAVVGGAGYVGGVQDEVADEFVTGDNYTIKVTAIGDTYSAYVDGSATPATTFTTAQFPTGQVGLYDDQPNVTGGGSGAPMTFSDFSLTAAGSGATITPTLVKGRLPASVITGQKSPIGQTVVVSNETGAAFNDTVTTQWFLDTGTNLDGSRIALTTPKVTRLRLGKVGHAALSFHIGALPASVPAGTYHVVAEITDTGGSSVAASATTVTVVAPVIVLSESLTLLKKIQAGGTAVIANAGNIVDNARFTQTVGFSTDPAGQVTAGTAVTTVRPLRVNFNRELKVHVAVTKAQLLSLTPLQDYYLTVTEIDASGHVVKAVSTTPFALATDPISPR